MTFVELARKIEGFGGGSLAVEIGPNVILWDGVSQLWTAT
jgi:hypothetical protein